jgi:SAM-dependent methyltransferase
MLLAGPRIAEMREMESARFRSFMSMLNRLAEGWGLRTFTNWSKIWEYPWLWFNGLGALPMAGLRVFDIGSERSPMPWFLAHLGASVTLVERDPRWVPGWEELRRATGLAVDWEIVESSRIPAPDRSQDLVTSFSVLEHLEDKPQAIVEVARVLKPGGILAISFDLCEPDLGMTFPEWNGRAITMREFEELCKGSDEFEVPTGAWEWNTWAIPSFLAWHRTTAPHHNYVVGAAVLKRRPESERRARE